MPMSTTHQGYSIEGKILGIVGMGRIGQQVARFAKAFGMTIIYHNRHQVDDQIAAELDAKYVDLDTLAKEADFVSLHTPATAETYHLVNSDFLKKMKDTAFLINVARGSLIRRGCINCCVKEWFNCRRRLRCFRKRIRIQDLNWLKWIM